MPVFSDGEMIGQEALEKNDSLTCLPKETLEPYEAV